MHTRVSTTFTFLFFALVTLVPATSTAQTAASPAQVTVTQAQPSLARDSARAIRDEFYEILQQHPPALGRVLRLDPTLLANQQYLAAYPAVAAFLAQHPDIARNPDYYLERYQQAVGPAEPRQMALSMWRDAIEFVGAFLVFAAVVATVLSILRYIVEYRRWNRVSKVTTEVHNKILDRFGSNEELLAYIDSPAGRRFLEATPITPSSAARPAAPFGRVLISVQVGVMLVALALGLLLVAKGAVEEVQQLLTGIAVIAFFLGVGSVVSAAASYLLSRKLGLLPETGSSTSSTAV